MDYQIWKWMVMKKGPFFIAVCILTKGPFFDTSTQRNDNSGFPNMVIRVMEKKIYLVACIQFFHCDIFETQDYHIWIFLKKKNKTKIVVMKNLISNPFDYQF